MRVGLWTRWAGLHGVPRAFFAVQARRGDPLGRLIANHGLRDDRYLLLEQIRVRGPLVRTPFVWVSVDHGVCREILRDKRFANTSPKPMKLLAALISRTDPGVPNPVEPPAMVVVDPPDHTRYRQLLAQSFTPRAIDTLSARVTDVTAELIDSIAGAPHPDLIADFAAQLPIAIMIEMFDLPIDSHPRVLQWGHSGAPLAECGIGWKAYSGAIDGLRDVDQFLRLRFRQVRAGEPGYNPFTRMAADGTLTDRELTTNAAMLIGASFVTTLNLIGNGIVVLLQHPEQLARLRDDPGLWPAAIEEILRIDSPLQMTGAHRKPRRRDRGTPHRGRRSGRPLARRRRPRPISVHRPQQLRYHPIQCARPSGVRGRSARLPQHRPGPDQRRCYRTACAVRDVSRSAPGRASATAGSGKHQWIHPAAGATGRGAEPTFTHKSVARGPGPWGGVEETGQGRLDR